MSTQPNIGHFRHCPKHRKPLPCAHCALAAKAAQASKRGPKPKFGVTMTPAQRKALSRENQKTKLQDAERRKLIVELMKIYRRQQSSVKKTKNKKAVEQQHEATRTQRRQYLDGLSQLSLAELQLALQVQKQTPDLHGRLHNESSGEDKRMFGMSEIERIDAARQHDSSLVDLQSGTILPGESVGISAGNGQDPLLAAGYGVKLEGRGPDTFDRNDETADSADAVRSGTAKPEYKPTTDDKWLQRAIVSMIRRARYKCAVCNEKFAVGQGADNHLHEQYGKGGRDSQKHREFVFAVAALNSSGAMPGQGMPVFMEPRTTAYLHYKRINLDIERLSRACRRLSRRKRARKKTRDISDVAA